MRTQLSTLFILFTHLFIICPLDRALAFFPDIEAEFLPDGRIDAPIVANPQEARIGLRKEIGSSRMKLDIGGTLDLVEARFSPGMRVRFGVSFFTYALTTSRQGLRLQVDAADGFFGGYLILHQQVGTSSVQARLRVLHLSSHFVDGHYDLSSGQWINGKGPVPMTKDFGELTGSFSTTLSPFALMVYTGIGYAALVRPDQLRRGSGMFGMEGRTTEEQCTAFSRPLIGYCAYHLSVVGIPSYVGSSTFESGIKFGRWAGPGVRLFVSYQSGLEVFGQYFDSHRGTWNLGFTFDM